MVSAQVPGDLMEAGVFRGGACIFLRGLLAAAFPAEATRRVFVADSFAGIPPPRLAERETKIFNATSI